MLSACWQHVAAVHHNKAPCVVQVGIYMPLYDILIRKADGVGGGTAPLLAGGLARTVAVLCTAPLELVRTRTQALFHPQTGRRGLALAATAAPSMWSHISFSPDLSALGRVQLLWRGAPLLTSTLGHQAD